MARGSDNVRNGRGGPGSVEARGKKLIQISGSRQIGDGSEGLGTHLMKLAISDPLFVTDAGAGKMEGESRTPGVTWTAPSGM